MVDNTISHFKHIGVYTMKCIIEIAGIFINWIFSYQIVKDILLCSILVVLAYGVLNFIGLLYKITGIS
jgi:uncharacterized membrane protein YwaF